MNPAAQIIAVLAIILAACAGCEVGRLEERRKWRRQRERARRERKR